MSRKWAKAGLAILLVLIFLNQRRYYIKCLLGNNQPGVNILAYHHVVGDEEKNYYWKNNLDVMSVTQFEKHMRYLYEAGYTTLTLDELYDWKKGNISISEKSVVITFDDGYTSLTEVIQPILEKYGFCASCFIIGSYVQEKTVPYEEGKLHYLGLDILKEENDVFSFYSHGYDLHEMENGQSKIETIDADELKEDILKQRKVTQTDYFAYPWGKANRLLYETLKEAGVKLAFSYANFGPVTHLCNDENIPRWAMFSYMSVKDVQDILRK